MSLTSIITGKERQELRDKFKTVFPRPDFNVNVNIVARSSTTNNSSIVGAAFDYLLRLYLEHRRKGKVHSSGEWVADNAFKNLFALSKINKSKKIAVGFKKDILINRNHFEYTLVSEYIDAKGNYDKYLENGVLTDGLIKSSLFLARLDVYYRSGIIDPNFGKENDLDIADIQNIFKHINSKDFNVKKHCYINPNFGNASILVQGADADIIIDDLLIDIKVTKDIKLERNDLNQVIGYYILSLIGGINKEENLKPVKNIAIYFARYGFLWKYPLSNFVNEQAIEEFKNWFINYINQKVWHKKIRKTNRS